MKCNQELCEKIEKVLQSESLSSDDKKSITSLLNDYKSATYDSDRQGFYQTQLSRFVNSFDFDEKAAAKAMATDHPTVQQGYMRLVCSFIHEMAIKTYCDDRNRDSVELAQTLDKIIKVPYLPLI